LREFCSQYLLYWVEVCSLLGELRGALVALDAAQKALVVRDFSCPHYSQRILTRS
jgi:hypothetical protein